MSIVNDMVLDIELYSKHCTLGTAPSQYQAVILHLEGLNR